MSVVDASLVVARSLDESLATTDGRPARAAGAAGVPIVELPA